MAETYSTVLKPGMLHSLNGDDYDGGVEYLMNKAQVRHWQKHRRVAMTTCPNESKVLTPQVVEPHPIPNDNFPRDKDGNFTWAKLKNIDLVKEIKKRNIPGDLESMRKAELVALLPIK